MITIVTTNGAANGSGPETTGGEDSTGAAAGAGGSTDGSGSSTATPTVVKSEARGPTVCKRMAMVVLFAVFMQ
jgi:hypothetical protein